MVREMEAASSCLVYQKELYSAINRSFTKKKIAEQKATHLEMVSELLQQCRFTPYEKSATSAIQSETNDDIRV